MTKFLRFLGGCAAALLLAGSASAAATDVSGDLKEPGKLVIAVYNNFPPYSNGGQGIDADVGQAIAERMGLKADIMSFNAGEDMTDDLRNSVWKGHYLNGRTGDVMLHVPVDKVLMKASPQVRIFGAYHKEVIGIARDQRRVPQILGPAGLEAFTREKIGVEGATISDAFLMGAFGGRLRENVAHFKSVPLAAEALKRGEVSAVMAPITELEAALKGRPDHLVITPFGGPIIAVENWRLGMAVKKESAKLAEGLEQALNSLIADGSIKAIFARHGVTWHHPESN